MIYKPASIDKISHRNRLELIAAGKQILDSPRKRRLHVFLGLQRIMKHDYRAVACIAPDVVEHPFGSELARVVARHEVVEDYVVVILDGTGLLPAYQPVRGAEKRRAYQGVGTIYEAADDRPLTPPAIRLQGSTKQNRDIALSNPAKVIIEYS